MAAAAEAVENEVVRADYPFWIENNQIRFDDMKLQRHVEQYFMDYDDSSVDGEDDVTGLDVVKYFKTLSALNPISARFKKLLVSLYFNEPGGCRYNTSRFRAR